MAIFDKQWWTKELLLVEIVDDEVEDRIIKGFNLYPFKQGFGRAFKTTNGKASPSLSKRINTWVSKNFPESHVKVAYEKTYATINIFNPNILHEANFLRSQIIESENSDSRMDTVNEFMQYAIEKLDLQNPTFTLNLSQDNNEAKSRHSFGTFDPRDNSIWLYTGNRNLADILRTLAHELIHRKQAEDGRLEPNSGETGSNIENEANAMAGILLRDFGAKNENIYEGKYGDYLFGDQNSGVSIGYYEDEKEEDTPAEISLFNLLKQYADSEAETYSNINLDSLIPTFKILKKQYPEIANPKINDGVYIYRGTAMSEDKLQELEANADTESYNQGVIILDQVYSSRRKVQSWSTNYFNAATFAINTAERKGGVPVIMRTKASNADLYFDPTFMDKLSSQLEDETFNIINPIPADIMVIENYQDEFEDIESGYLHNK